MSDVVQSQPEDVMPPVEPVPAPIKEKIETQKPKPVSKPVSTEKIKRFKLNLYADSGTIRPIFTGSILRDASRKFGDIIRAVSSTRYMTEDEVCESVWIIEKKMRYPANRSRKQICDAVQELIDRQIIVTD